MECPWGHRHLLRNYIIPHARVGPHFAPDEDNDEAAADREEDEGLNWGAWGLSEEAEAEETEA